MARRRGERDSTNTGSWLMMPGSWLLVLIFALALPPLWFSLIAAPKLRIEVGMYGDSSYLSGMNEPERNATESFRWTGGVAELRLPNLSSRYQELRLHAHGWRPAGIALPQVQIAAGGTPWTSVQLARDLRLYHVLLPRDGARATTDIRFTTPVYSAPNDSRELGFGLDWLELRPLSRGGPTAWQLGGQALLLGLALVLLGWLGLPWRWAAAVAALLAAALIYANLLQPLWVSAALAIWLIEISLLLLATVLLAPWLKRRLVPWMSARQASIAWALLVAALALRLLGETHPLFDMHDIGFHHIWLDAATQGDLYIFSAPSEFQNRQTFNPPAGYILLMPLQLLLPNERLAIQAGLALADGLGCLFLLLLARELGLGGRAALIALALYLALPINITMLWWGFATNALAQSAGLALLWMLLRLVAGAQRAARSSAEPRNGGWWAALVVQWPSLAAFVVVACLALLMHVGALVLLMALLCASLGLGWWRLAPPGRAAIVGGLGLALAFSALIYFSAVAPAALAQPPGTAPPPSLAATLAASWGARALKLSLVRQAFALGFLPLGVALAPLGYAQLLRLRRHPPLARPLLLAWLLVCVLFLAVYFGLGLLVRYLYFATPLICLGLGALLAGLWPRGRVVVLALVLLVLWSGLALWAAGVLQGAKPSLLPLTH